MTGPERAQVRVQLAALTTACCALLLSCVALVIAVTAAHREPVPAKVLRGPATVIVCVQDLDETIGTQRCEVQERGGL